MNETGGGLDSMYPYILPYDSNTINKNNWLNVMAIVYVHPNDTYNPQYKLLCTYIYIRLSVVVINTLINISIYIHTYIYSICHFTIWIESAAAAVYV